jgi:hypothetical protein
MARRRFEQQTMFRAAIVRKTRCAVTAGFQRRKGVYEIRRFNLAIWRLVIWRSGDLAIR